MLPLKVKLMGMLHFFRLVRRKLLTENRFSKYLLYAIGEILLVVIGILIALYINNWNQERIAAEDTKFLFEEVSDELVQNIKSIDRVLAVNIRKDTYYFSVLNNKVGPEDYQADGYLSNFPFNWIRTSLVDEDFKELVAKKGNLTELQDSIFSELKDLYAQRKTNTDKDDETQIITQHNFRDKMMNEQPWWSHWNTAMGTTGITDDMIQFWLTDPIYRNQLSELRFREYWHTMGMLWFRSKALQLHIEIADMLNMEKASALVKDLAALEHVIGRYAHLGNEFDIRWENGLKQYYFVNDTVVSEIDVYPYRNSHLIFSGSQKGQNYLGRIEYGKNGEVLGLSLFGEMSVVDGGRRLDKKIE